MPNETQSIEKEIEVLRKRHENLNKLQIQAERDLKHAEDKLKELMESARKEYGTDDLDALHNKLKEMKTENERKCRDYKEHLDALEKKLNDIEQDNKESTEGVT